MKHTFAPFLRQLMLLHMTTPIDVDAYFNRIGYHGSRAATLDTLRALVLAHTQSIPFENLDPLARRPVHLSNSALEAKLIARGRGGYCFEQNLLLSDVLTQLGFRVTRLLARVMWTVSTSLPRSHMLMIVEVAGDPYVVDVGFGGLTLTGVLCLAPNVEQCTPHEPFRLLTTENEYVLQARVQGEWRPLYRFDLQPQQPVDYEPINWYVSTHPESRFVKNLIAARVMSDRRYALFNAEMATHYLSGETQRRTLSSADELRRVLENEFLIRLPSGGDVDEGLARAFRGT